MKIIVCLDEHNGMMFNKRRLSQDVQVRLDILKHLNHYKLWMNSYAYQMFKDNEGIEKIIVEENLPVINNDFQFIEDKSLNHYVDYIDELIIYYWNRSYPSDMQFDISLENWQLICEKDIVGNSHDQITKKIFQKARDNSR